MTKPFRISNSGLDTYSMCPKKYYFRYIEKVKGDYTATPLLFGSAIDAALNYILESIRDKKEWDRGTAEDIFQTYMNKWDQTQRLEYFKNELPEYEIDPEESEERIQLRVWNNLCFRGVACLKVYIEEVLPQIEEVLSVQPKFEVVNDDGDVFTGVIDFIAKLKDGRTVLLDNKTASAKYPKNKVVKSQQLSLYADQYPEITHFGYIVLIKNPAKEKGMTHQVIVDQIPEETIAASFKLLDNTMRAIKEEKFPTNYKSCKAFGKTCEYERACSYGDYSGLISARREDAKEETRKDADQTLTRKDSSNKEAV